MQICEIRGEFNCKAREVFSRKVAKAQSLFHADFGDSVRNVNFDLWRLVKIVANLKAK